MGKIMKAKMKTKMKMTRKRTRMRMKKRRKTKKMIKLDNTSPTSDLAVNWDQQRESAGALYSRILNRFCTLCRSVHCAVVHFLNLIRKYDKSRSIISRLFDIEAEHGDSEEEDEGRGPTAGAEVIVQEDERQAIEAVQRRHAQNREFLGRDAAALAAEYQRKAREERSHRINNLYYDSGTGIGSSIASGKSLGAVLQQSLLPSVSDPCIWRFKVRTGSEQEVVEKIMRKAIDSRMRGGPLRIKSAFYGAKNGYVYVEGMAEPLTREAITGGLCVVFCVDIVCRWKF